MEWETFASNNQLSYPDLNTHSLTSLLVFQTAGLTQDPQTRRLLHHPRTDRQLSPAGPAPGKRPRSPSATRAHHTSGVGDHHRPQNERCPPPRPVPGRGWMVSMITSVISLRPRCWWRMAARSPGPFPSKQDGTATGTAPVFSAAISGAAQEKRGVGTERWEREPRYRDPPAAPGRRSRFPPRVPVDRG